VVQAHLASSDEGDPLTDRNHISDLRGNVREDAGGGRFDLDGCFVGFDLHQ
jgi:hypothetical protein